MNKLDFFQCFWLNSVIRVNVKKYEHTQLFYTDTLLHYQRSKVNDELLLLLSPLITATSRPSWLEHFPEGVIWMCTASFNSSSHPLPFSNSSVSSHWIGCYCNVELSANMPKVFTHSSHTGDYHQQSPPFFVLSLHWIYETEPGDETEATLRSLREDDDEVGCSDLKHA